MAGLNKHFVLAQDASALPDLDRRDEVLGWHVARGADLRLYPVRHPDGTEAGAVLGWLIDQAGGTGLLPDGTALAAPVPGEDYRTWSMDFSGRFVCLLETGAGRRFHTDAAGLLGAVYAPGARMIAATPGLIDAPEDPDLTAAFGVPRRFGWYPFGLTPRVGVSRLMPNFALDLETFAPTRFWPDAAPGEAGAGARPVVAEIHTAVTRAVTALAGHGQIAAHLTAGYDSRMVLAAAWPVRAKLDFVTIGAIPGTGADLDAATAAHLARRFGLRHQTRPFLPGTEADRDDWIARTGGCIADHVTSLAATVRSWPEGEIQLAGISGELARAFYWTAAEIAAPPPETRELLARIKAPDTQAVRAAAEAWRASLPPMPGPLFWDMVYLEQRLGCWAGPAVYGAHQPVPSLGPFNSRRIMEAMLSLPAAYRASNAFPSDFIALSEPGLNRIPYNRPFGLAALKDPAGWLKGMLPKNLKTRLKRLRQRLRTGR